MRRLLVTLAVASALFAASSLQQQVRAAVPTKVRDTGIGPVLADPDGITLYTFDNDAPGQSTCQGECADRWHPYWAVESEQPEGDYTMISRPDGSKQWAYKGMPLYTLRDDAAPGDIKGDGDGGVWHAVRP